MNRVKKKSNKKAVDFMLLIAITMLVFIGIIMVFSASWPVGMSEENDGYYFLKRQIIWSAMGFLGLFIAMNFDYRKLKKWAPYIFFLSIILGLLVFTPMGAEIKGARRWLDIGPIRIMPSDAIKFGSVVFFAKFLANKRENIDTVFQGTLPALIYIGLACGVIIQEDLGTGGTIAITMMAMFFVGGMNILHMAPLGVGAAGVFYLAINDPDSSYRLARITAFIDPFADKLDTGWQLVQSLYSLGSGGVFGLGLGKSRQKFFYLSEAYNDFIFAIIGEELGLVGTVIVILLFLIVIWRGIIIALKTEDLFGCFLATGITALIAVQSLIHIAVVTSSMPTTGITLPFVSYGGTSLVMFMTLVGILLNISRNVNFERS
ncbi:putative lipid II flippase FtsW [Tissierella creatinophila]|uniref:Probable peptidoglycan glycosyltransferase FtsW n=1 Tax=Tissierella creatinophila DSM 6911 TaxID=1123403 RepID=A0A1U7M989_TISCR|nr:putative lipid II flippase FtsW [Tissierella creatinophila]OLS03882.1 lipid II flippase FtsW [Tissierella creatinophila DSM 6911]